MPCYVVSYDLRKSRDYESLYEAIKSYGSWAHVLESTWAIVTDKTHVEVRDHLLEHIDDDDGIFVVKSGGAGAWHSVLCQNKWLKDNL